MTKFSTIQMAQYRKAKALNVELIDTTVKSGNPIFAPTWEMVKAWKSGNLSKEEYSRQYGVLMFDSFKEHRLAWLDIFKKESVALACYCRAGDFCHRHLLKSYFEKIARSSGQHFEDGGEIL